MAGMDIILSIKPEYSQKILSGEKTVEFRRKFTSKPIDRVYIYESAPTKMVVGEFRIEVVNSNYPCWIFEEGNGLTLDEFYKYVGNLKWVYGIHIKDVIRYETPKPLSAFGLTRPPQNYCFVKEATNESQD